MGVGGWIVFYLLFRRRYTTPAFRSRLSLFQRPTLQKTIPHSFVKTSKSKGERHSRALLGIGTYISPRCTNSTPKNKTYATPTVRARFGTLVISLSKKRALATMVS